MKLLLITQKVDRNDSSLGFFHRWIEEFAKHTESLIVICLEEGEYNFPGHVRVLSLGKEKGQSKIKYLKNFFKYIWRERRNYDGIFVHMNEEYVLLGGLWWKLMGRKITLWRNHINGTWKTPLAVFLSDVVFCTSPYSYTAKFKKTIIAPAGINIDKFRAEEAIERLPRSILSMGRIAPVKNVDILIKALVLLDDDTIDFQATVAGDAEEKDKEYYNLVRNLASPLIDKGKVTFTGSVPNPRTPEFYHSHELFVNLTNSGSLDKMIFSAMASGTLVILSNVSFHGILPEKLIFKENDVEDLKEKLKNALLMPQYEKQKIVDSMKKYVDENHSLEETVKVVLEAFQV